MRYLAPVLILALVLAVAYYGMWRGWWTRANLTAGMPPLPTPPPGLPAPATSAEGLYAGAARPGQWLDRITSHGLGARAKAIVEVYADGVALRRDGAAGVWLAAGSLRAVRRDRALAGKVVEDGGLVVVTWSHADTELDLGFRPTRADDADALESAVGALVERAAHER